MRLFLRSRMVHSSTPNCQATLWLFAAGTRIQWQTFESATPLLTLWSVHSPLSCFGLFLRLYCSVRRHAHKVSYGGCIHTRVSKVSRNSSFSFVYFCGCVVWVGGMHQNASLNGARVHTIVSEVSRVNHDAQATIVVSSTRAHSEKYADPFTVTMLRSLRVDDYARPRGASRGGPLHPFIFVLGAIVCGHYAYVNLSVKERQAKASAQRQVPPPAKCPCSRWLPT